MKTVSTATPTITVANQSEADAREIAEVLDALADFAQGAIVKIRAENESLIESLLRKDYATGSLTYPSERRAQFDRQVAPTLDLIRRAGELADRLEGKVVADNSFEVANEAKEKAERERDAALAVASYAGQNLFCLTDEQIFQRLGDSVRAWLDDAGTEERLRVSAAIRKAAGLES